MKFHRKKNALISEIEVRRYKKGSDFSVAEQDGSGNKGGLLSYEQRVVKIVCR